MLKGMTALLLFQLAGEVVAAVFLLPVPGPIIGVAFLLIWLYGQRRVGDDLANAADGLLANMSVLFVPVGVGAMAHPGLFQRHWPFIVAALAVGTVVTLATAALTTKVLMRMRARRAPSLPLPREIS
jgi:holin-like protein